MFSTIGKIGTLFSFKKCFYSEDSMSSAKLDSEISLWAAEDEPAAEKSAKELQQDFNTYIQEKAKKLDVEVHSTLLTK